jgi:hypothetical protein
MMSHSVVPTFLRLFARKVTPSRLMHDSKNDNREEHLPMHCVGIWRNEYGLAKNRGATTKVHGVSTLKCSVLTPQCASIGFGTPKTGHLTPPFLTNHNVVPGNPWVRRIGVPRYPSMWPPYCVASWAISARLRTTSASSVVKQPNCAEMPPIGPRVRITGS